MNDEPRTDPAVNAGGDARALRSSMRRAQLDVLGMTYGWRRFFRADWWTAFLAR